MGGFCFRRSLTSSGSLPRSTAGWHLILITRMDIDRIGNHKEDVSRKEVRASGITRRNTK